MMKIVKKIVLAGILLLMPLLIVAQQPKMSGPLAHQVFFWLTNADNTEARVQFEQAITELLKIDLIKQSHFGIPATTREREVTDHSFSYSLILIFESKEAQDAYQIHDIHKKFVDQNKHLWKKVLVYDSYTVTD